MRIINSTFGDYIRGLRRKEGLPLRKVAAELDIDPSTLGKIEKNTRRPSKGMLKEISRVFKTEYEPLLIYSLSDKMYAELKNEELRFEVLKATEKKLKAIQKEKK